MGVKSKLTWSTGKYWPGRCQSDFFVLLWWGSLIIWGQAKYSLGIQCENRTIFTQRLSGHLLALLGPKVIMLCRVNRFGVIFSKMIITAHLAHFLWYNYSTWLIVQFSQKQIGAMRSNAVGCNGVFTEHRIVSKSEKLSDPIKWLEPIDIWKKIRAVCHFCTLLHPAILSDSFWESEMKLVRAMWRLTKFIRRQWWK